MRRGCTRRCTRLTAPAWTVSSWHGRPSRTSGSRCATGCGEPPPREGSIVMNRADAYALMTEYTQSDSLRKHMLAVEAAMRAYARKLGEDEEKWGVVGLLHDFDYERWPDPPNHPLKGSEILREKGYPEEVIYAIKSHADYLPDCPRVNLLDKALYE